MRSLALALAACSLALTGCGTAAPVPAGEPPAGGVAVVPVAVTVALPPVDGRWDYQIGGAYPPAASVAVVDRDRSAQPVPGRYSVCYVNAFQTQPQEAGFWRTRHPDLLLRKDGRLVDDPDWPGEHLLDTRTAAQRRGIAAVLDGWIAGCADKGFSAVEPDNLDSWTRSKGLLTRQGNLALAALLTSYAHGRGLAVAQKNTGQLGTAGRDTAHFDFAIAEECQVYRECGSYTGPYGRHVVEIEYTDDGRAAFTSACAARGPSISVVLRDPDVVPRGASGYRYEWC